MLSIRVARRSLSSPYSQLHFVKSSDKSETKGMNRNVYHNMSSDSVAYDRYSQPFKPYRRLLKVQPGSCTLLQPWVRKSQRASTPLRALGEFQGSRNKATTSTHEIACQLNISKNVLPEPSREQVSLKDSKYLLCWQCFLLGNILPRTLAEVATGPIDSSFGPIGDISFVLLVPFLPLGSFDI